MTWFTCPNCQSVEFQRIVQYNIGADGRVIEGVEGAVFKCSNCGQRFQIQDDDSVLTLQTSAQRGTATHGPRVRSSVSGDARGVEQGKPKQQF